MQAVSERTEHESQQSQSPPPPSFPDLEIRGLSRGEVECVGLRHVNVTTLDQAVSVLEESTERRTKRGHSMNEDSSRSHFGERELVEGRHIRY